MGVVIRLKIVLQTFPKGLQASVDILRMGREHIKLLSGPHRPIVYGQHSQIAHKPGSNLESSNGTGGFDNADELYAFPYFNELQIVIVEAFMHYERLQESDELYGVVLVRLGQIDLLQDHYLPVAVLGTQHLPVG
jgi:hypothetical protein